MPRVSALQRAGPPATSTTDPALSVAETALRKGRIGREQALKGKHGRGEAGQAEGPRRRSGKRAGSAVGAVPSTMRSRGEKNTNPRSTKLRGGDEIGRAIVKDVRLVVGVSANLIKRKELLLKRDMGKRLIVVEMLGLGDQISFGVIEVDPP